MILLGYSFFKVKGLHRLLHDPHTNTLQSLEVVANVNLTHNKRLTIAPAQPLFCPYCIHRPHSMLRYSLQYFCLTCVTLTCSLYQSPVFPGHRNTIAGLLPPLYSYFLHLILFTVKHCVPRSQKPDALGGDEDPQL